MYSQSIIVREEETHQEHAVACFWQNVSIRSKLTLLEILRSGLPSMFPLSLIDHTVDLPHLIWKLSSGPLLYIAIVILISTNLGQKFVGK